MGIEPTLSAWKAEVLPLNYTRELEPKAIWWRGKDLNLRRLSRQIYSLIPLTTREPLRIAGAHYREMTSPGQPICSLFYLPTGSTAAVLSSEALSSAVS